MKIFDSSRAFSVVGGATRTTGMNRCTGESTDRTWRAGHADDPEQSTRCTATRSTARELRRRRGHATDDAIVFPNTVGNPLSVDNLRNRVLQPTAESGSSWIGFHTFCHTAASLIFARGADVVQVSRWLGHADASFTLRTYVDWLRGDNLGDPLDLPGLRTDSRTDAAVFGDTQPSPRVVEVLLRA